MNVILIKDLLDSRKRKEEELRFYTSRLKELEFKLNLVRSEINLTNKILGMIRKDEIKSLDDL